MRENEFHLLKSTGWFSCPFVVLTSKPPVAAVPEDDRDDAEHGPEPVHRDRRAAKQHARNGAQHRRRDDGAWRAQQVQRGHQQQAPGAGAQEVGCVDGVDVRAQARDRDRDRGAAREERHRGQQVHRAHQRDVRGRVAQADFQADQHEERHDRADRERKGMPGEQPLRRHVAPAVAHQEHVHAARAQPEQGDRDRHEREVVVHRDREDARERQLGHEQRAGNQGDAEEGTGRDGRGHASV